jgi:hypothetical protein
VDLVGQDHQPTNNITTTTSPQHITIIETSPPHQHTINQPNQQNQDQNGYLVQLGTR